MAPIILSIVGATGQLGFPIAQALLSKTYFPVQIGRIQFITRDASSEKARTLIAQGAEAIEVPENTINKTHFKDVDVVVNCVRGHSSVEVKNSYVDAAVGAGVKVYFPPTFGLDHSLIDLQNTFFQARESHIEYTRKVAVGKMKVINLCPGILMEFLISPMAGFDVEKNVYTCWSDPGVKATTTAKKDVGQVVARLTVLASADPNSVPDTVRVVGDCKSYREIADVMSKESGEPIKVEAGDYETIKADIVGKAKGEGYVLEYFRLAIAGGQIDWTNCNHNELVNPGQSFWRWATLADLAKQSKGKPSFPAKID